MVIHLGQMGNEREGAHPDCKVLGGEIRTFWLVGSGGHHPLRMGKRVEEWENLKR